MDAIAQLCAIANSPSRYYIAGLVRPNDDAEVAADLWADWVESMFDDEMEAIEMFYAEAVNPHPTALNDPALFDLVIEEEELPPVKVEKGGERYFFTIYGNLNISQSPSGYIKEVLWTKLGHTIVFCARDEEEAQVIYNSLVTEYRGSSQVSSLVKDIPWSQQLNYRYQVVDGQMITTVRKYHEKFVL